MRGRKPRLRDDRRARIGFDRFETKGMALVMAWSRTAMVHRFRPFSEFLMADIVLQLVVSAAGSVVALLGVLTQTTLERPGKWKIHRLTRWGWIVLSLLIVLTILNIVSAVRAERVKTASENAQILANAKAEKALEDLHAEVNKNGDLSEKLQAANQQLARQGYLNILLSLAGTDLDSMLIGIVLGAGNDQDYSRDQVADFLFDNFRAHGDTVLYDGEWATRLYFDGWEIDVSFRAGRDKPDITENLDGVATDGKAAEIFLKPVTTTKDGDLLGLRLFAVAKQRDRKFNTAAIYRSVAEADGPVSRLSYNFAPNTARDIKERFAERWRHMFKVGLLHIQINPDADIWLSAKLLPGQPEIKEDIVIMNWHISGAPTLSTGRE